MPNTYCTRNEVEMIISSQGVENRTESPTGNQSHDNVVDSYIDMASAEIEVMLQKKYDLNTLTSNRWVKWATAVIAAYRLCSYKGWTIPASIENWFEQIMAAAMRISIGTFEIPGANPRVEALPAMSNMHVDLAYRTRHNRRDFSTSVPISGNNVPGVPIHPSGDFPAAFS